MSAAIPMTNLARPRDVAEAVMTRRSSPDSEFIAGGTDLLVNMRHGIKAPATLIDLSGIDEMSAIDVIDGATRIGAGISIAKLARDPLIAVAYPAIRQAAEQIAGPGHRAVGTVGGNLCLDTRCIYYNQSEWWRSANKYCLKLRGDTCHVAPQGQRCHAAFTGDLAPALLVLRAEVEIANGSGRRRIPLDDMYVEDGRSHLKLAKDDLVVAVYLPPTRIRSAYAKIRVRGAIDFPLAGVAVALAAVDGTVSSFRIALTGTNSRPFVLAGTDAIVGQPIDERALQEIDRQVQKQVHPVRTTIASAHYRRLAAAGLARRLTAALYLESKAGC